MPDYTTAAIPEGILEMEYEARKIALSMAMECSHEIGVGGIISLADQFCDFLCGVSAPEDET